MEIWLYLAPAVANKADMNIYVWVFVWTYAFFSLGKIPRSQMAEICGVCIFNFLIKYQNIYKMLYHFILPLVAW